MTKKLLTLLVFATLVTGCNKNDQNFNAQISSASLHINKGIDVEQITLTETDTSKFADWLKTKQDQKETKYVKALTTPLWCFVFNEGVKNKLMIYCYYPKLEGVALQKDYLIKNVDFYPLNKTDKAFFKTNFSDLSELNF